MSSQSVVLPYGAFELKRYYQRNMIRGIGFAAALTVFCILSIWLYQVITFDEAGESSNFIRIKTIADLGQPPGIAQKPPQIDIAKPEMAMPKVGIPTPVADEEVSDEDVVMATRDELKEITAPAVVPTEASGSQLVIDIPEEDYMPPPDAFVAVEVDPVQVYEETPEYPRLARDGGFTGYVIVQAFVDKNGFVKKAQAVKCTRPGMGFEEAAVKAAYKCQWKPAIQNGNPIGVWVAYKVDFVFENQ
ncbi:MAG: TonB family protein [Patescibacteria group bacterium]|jgi:TonB family protein